MGDPDAFLNIFFVGIGGVSMSGLAEIYHNIGHTISGYDRTSSEITDNLIKKGIKVYIGDEGPSHITEDIDLVVYTSSIPEANKELKKARELGIKTMERPVFLSGLMKEYKNSIAVSGTHGKTTTSSMVSEVFLYAKKNPTITIGGILKSQGSNLVIGENEYLILEACEYKDAFLSFMPSTSIILNIDEDHLDYFKDIHQIRDSFKKFAQNTSSYLIINNNIPDLNEIISGLNIKVITYGNDLANIKATSIVYDINGCGSYDLIYNGENLGRISLHVPGYHNVSNSLAAAASTLCYGIPFEDIKTGLLNFEGAKRRLDFMGEFNGVKVMDDYAHHPVEIKTTITALRAMPHNKIWIVFQSHTYTRTKALLDDFALALKDADNIIITDIYAAREVNDVSVYPEDIVNLIKEYNNNALYIKSFSDIANHLKKHCAKGDIVVTMGAGDINKLVPYLI